MSEANTATYDVLRARLTGAVRGGEGTRRSTIPLKRHPQWPAADRAIETAFPRKRPTTGRASSVDAGSGAYGSLAVARPARHGFELREDPFEEDDDREETDYAIPNVLTGIDPASHRDVLAAAEAHAHNLRNAEAGLDEAIHLVAVLLGTLEDADEAQAIQVETVLKLVEKRLNKVYNRIDRHGTAHTNLFLAYFELKARAEGGLDPEGEDPEAE